MHSIRSSSVFKGLDLESKCDSGSSDTVTHVGNGKYQVDVEGLLVLS